MQAGGLKKGGTSGKSWGVCMCRLQADLLHVFRSGCFQEWLRRRGMIDLGYNGPKITWGHGTDASQRKAGRLDSALADNNWHRQFLEATVTHWPHPYSD